MGFIFGEDGMRRLWFALLVLLSLAVPAAAQSEAPVLAPAVPRTAPTTKIEVAQLPPAGVAHFDVSKAVDAYMARLTPQEKARSDAYFEGGYVLQAVDLIYTLVVAGLLLWLGLSAGMRNLATAFQQSLAGRLLVYVLFGMSLTAVALVVLAILHTPKALWIALGIAAVSMVALSRSGFVRDMVAKIAASKFLQVPIYVVQYTVLTTLLTLPLTIYEGYFREHAYGLSNQTFAQWAHDYAINFGVSIVAMAVLLAIVYAVIRRAGRGWWVWGAGVTVAGMMFVMTVQPVYIAPLTNHYTALPDSGMRNAILSLARGNGIPANNVYVFDASKQSDRISANVSGLFGTTRISLNDNLLNRGTPSEVLAVLGHEMGHYVLGHIPTMILQFGLLIVVAFWFVDRAYRGLVSIFGGNWQVRTIEDPAGLALAMALISVFFFFATPVTNTIIRSHEIEADIFGLNAVRQPDAFATVVLKLSQYRKMSPSPLEEIVFYDHPSGRTRITEAMRWKAEHLNDPDIMAGPISPQ